MKRFTATFIFLVIPLIIISQTNHTSSFKTAGGHWVWWKFQDEKYILNICNNFDYNMIYINIPVNQINTFKSQLMALDKKYKEWIGVAAENNVTNIEKEIPISLSTFSNISGSVVASPQEKTITPVFRVEDGQICCFIRIKLVGNGFQQVCGWRLISTDLHKIINEVDIFIAKQNEKKQTEDLFH